LDVTSQPVASNDDPLVGRAIELCVAAAGAPARAGLSHERLFAELDELLTSADDVQVAALRRDPQYRRVRGRVLRVRAAYEYQRELALARAIVEARSEAPARGFRSACWYQQAHCFETGILGPFGCERMLFVGTGPFPTSAISYLRDNPGASVACIERDRGACAIAREVAAILGCSELEVIHAEALLVSEFTRFDCVLVGLVVGACDVEKRQVVQHFTGRVPPSALLAFRTAVGSGTIVYPSVDPVLLRGLRHRIFPNPPHGSFTLLLIDRSECEP